MQGRTRRLPRYGRKSEASRARVGPAPSVRDARLVVRCAAASGEVAISSTTTACDAAPEFSNPVQKLTSPIRTDIQYSIVTKERW